MRRKLRLFAAVVVVFMLAVLLLPLVTLYTNYGFVDQNSGSQYGYNQWFIGLRNGHWEYTSPIDDGSLPRDWISFRGTGHDFLFQPRLYSHGRPRYGSLMIQWLDNNFSLGPEHNPALREILFNQDPAEASEQIIRLTESF